ncbi:MAG: amidophosphoribosyltransferase, partial [Firmicutes bacterium]|nr:amidophosphoribosyltransferase [Bacillota bacterium]
MAYEVHDACGVFGVWGVPDAALMAYWGIFSLQHRGQESAGIATWVPGTGGAGRIEVHKGMGLVSEVLSPEQEAARPGSVAIGHVRYSTQGSSSLANAQPLVMDSRYGQLALAHNGNLVNAAALRAELARAGAVFQGDSDSELLAHLVARSGHAGLEDALKAALARLEGGFAFVVLSDAGLFGARDPAGLRPLVLGQLPDGQWVLASESCALDIGGARLVREVEPGELVRIGPQGLDSDRFAPPVPAAACSFEYIYFARADSRLGDRSAYVYRRELGRMLAREAPAEADVVVGVPDSSLPQAMGYAQELGLDYDLGLVKNRYIARTFIAPSQSERESGVQLKVSAVPEVVAGKRVVLVDDSLVRGTTSRFIVQLLRQAGAREVHMRIASPPYRHPCHYGIDTSRDQELLAARLPLEAVREAVGADSLAYLSLEGLTTVLG